MAKLTEGERTAAMAALREVGVSRLLILKDITLDERVKGCNPRGNTILRRLCCLS